MTTNKIVRDTAGNLYCVIKDENPGIPQAYLGYPVKKTRDGYVVKGKGEARLIRKFGCVEVAA